MGSRTGFKAALLEEAARHPGLALQIGRSRQAIIAPRSQFAAAGAPRGPPGGPGRITCGVPFLSPALGQKN